MQQQLLRLLQPQQLWRRLAVPQLRLVAAAGWG
jgi:hypothetical protein